MTLSIIIVNFNVRYFLEQCLFSVRRSAGKLTYEVIVVDNASSDRSRSYLEKRFPEVSFIWNKENLGFAKANNIGAALAKGDFILFLNPDTILTEDCLECCIAHMKVHSRAGALGVRMIDGSGKFLKESRRGFPSPMTAFFKLTGLSSLFPRSPYFARYHMGHIDPLENHVTDVLAGAFMMIRRNVFEKAGGFDEDFFMYGEDIDLSYRIQKAGFENLYLASTSIIHFKGESTEKSSLNHVRLFYKAMSVFAVKHYGSRRAGFFNALLQLGILARSFPSYLKILIQNKIKPRLSGYSMNILKRSSYHSTENGQTLIAASPEGYRRVLQIIGMNKAEKSQFGRISMKDLSGDLAGTVEGITNLLQRVSAKELICCPDNLSYLDILRIIQIIPGHINVRISAEGTDSIVGSGYAIGAAAN